jgi:hypothetical protein
MATILWTSYQEDHITRRHGVAVEHFDQAWHNPGRDDFAEAVDDEYGPYFESLGYTDDGQLLEMVWRWQAQRPELGELWPITAYFVDEDDTDADPATRQGPED